MVHSVGRICGAVNGKGELMQGLVSSLRPKGVATADVQNQHCLPFHHSDLGIVCLTTGKSWFDVSGIKGTSPFSEEFWKVKKWMSVVKDRAKYSSGEAAGITSRLMLADTFGSLLLKREKVAGEVVPNSAWSVGRKNHLGFVVFISRQSILH